ncbi:hypothetical protein RAZWK3B_11637 [Roseobacter sp. AzwK-3b]|uniref:hypothetical protein n=1 Tax=Roseobacter sp. AzwK-3b TaxID=351016 RepID=UPI000156A1B3|nr:hypothetical protein [Roseobacter sp. AzwK-3b]EDM69388.1 hypothetical protein RAZWK3B_11637 [Roseobacter sp. AzwK-3b]
MFLYPEPLLTREQLKQHFPDAVAELDKCNTLAELEQFHKNAAKGPMQVVRHTRARLIYARLPTDALPLEDQYTEDCVAERLYWAAYALKRIDATTRRLVKDHGYLGGMVAQLQPISKVGTGNFVVLKKESSVECTAEYCVWKWGLKHVEQDLRNALHQVAQSNNFT